MINFTEYTEDDAEIDRELPSRWEICWACNGEGKRVNPSIDGHGISASEMYELGDDFRIDYMSGGFDVSCSDCKGSGKVQTVDRDRADSKLLALYDEQEQELAESYAIAQAEIRAGC